MSCYSPVEGYMNPAGDVYFHVIGDVVRTLHFPCGRCVGCLLERSRQWAVRCMHEAQLYEKNCFITLTYAPEFLPVDNSLRYVDFQCFMKRLRKEFSSERQRIRFFMCGEYGGDFGRPHFHACLFNCFFDDQVYFKKSPSGSNVYTSKRLERLWPSGFSSVGELTFESAAYVARYVLKKRFDDVCDENSQYRFVDDYGEVHYREPEFCHMSLKPGIGAGWFDKYQRQIYARDYVVVNGAKAKPPRYYDKRLASFDANMMAIVKHNRVLKALELEDDNTPERLAVREQVAKARLSFKKRLLE